MEDVFCDRVDLMKDLVDMRFWEFFMYGSFLVSRGVGGGDLVLRYMNGLMLWIEREDGNVFFECDDWI